MPFCICCVALHVSCTRCYVDFNATNTLIASSNNRSYVGYSSTNINILLHEQEHHTSLTEPWTSAMWCAIFSFICKSEERKC